MQANSHDDQIIVRTVETKVLPSVNIKEFFQSNLFSPALREEDDLPRYDSGFAMGFFEEVLLPCLARDPETESYVSYIENMTFGQKHQLWHYSGLGTLVHKEHCRWRYQYMISIIQAIESYLANGNKTSVVVPASKKALKLARELFSATEHGCPGRQMFYHRFQAILVAIYACPQRATVAGTGGGGAVMDKAWVYKQLHAHSIRDIFSVPEEAFVLLTIRKYLLGKFGRRVYAIVAPQFQPLSMLPSALMAANLDHSAVTMVAAAPALPDIMDFTMEDVAPAATPDIPFEWQDVQYYRELCKALVAQESLKEASVLANLYDVFDVPLARNNGERGTSSDDDDEAMTKGGHAAPSPGGPRKRLRLSLARGCLNVRL